MTDASKRDRAGVREIVFGMWLKGVAAGECSVERALEAVRGPVSLLNALEGPVVFGRFAMRALDAAKSAPKQRRRRGMPTAWLKENRDLVDFIAKRGGLSRRDVGALGAGGRELPKSVFTAAAEVWSSYSVKVTPKNVQDAYYRK